ncbi:proteasome subunit beta type-1 [Salpingoeca rosetta]|uniref:Proteasome subunit beta type-1 n=1 Tax=Salpingoeca rosetta (strain ATCC 50818 / BSB-021) TaxID=946362 RepID=F2UCM4_SALR5|nr:proteasome subunit beta type-1 [Salpingoeca rosetta]EGD74331.1 proteasome subunit beta type-1 [Salpingoeca rosetta]|eukprot:XP_004993231.1 proteasome subunit beta type-1 [Salpingoeca rosetta]
MSSTDKTVLASAGFHGDVLTLVKRIGVRMQNYEYQHRKPMSTPACAQMLATMLYGKRFFPYYTYNILAGLDADGKGCVFSYDPVGSYEREHYRAAGTASALLQPFLDNQARALARIPDYIGRKNQQGVVFEPISKERAMTIIKDVFTSAAERDIYTGDAVDIRIVTKDGLEEHRFPLRCD